MKLLLFPIAIIIATGGNSQAKFPFSDTTLHSIELASHVEACNVRSEFVFSNCIIYYNGDSSMQKELRMGRAVVYNKTTGYYEQFILYRIERVISIADDVFYLADRRRLYRAMRYVGVLPNELSPEIE
ncbi:MAG TPA: hypothetical protein VGO58_19335 [Chitinophagaceae bacterium]|jgi:hypothetical protein|nr:hypothetical protein [Chitinophagaceae bacterium]